MFLFNKTPKYYLYPKINNKHDPIVFFANQLNENKIGILKGWSGFHVCTLIQNINKLRKKYNRPQKSFALMVKDLESIKNYAIPTKSEIKLVSSKEKPIVLMIKTKNKFSELLSPGLKHIGIFLPYLEVHKKIFNLLKKDSLIMTSANMPGEPMFTDEKVLSLGEDIYLMNDIKMKIRLDDSVIKINNNKKNFLRKSRGYAPYSLPFKNKKFTIGIGANENITFSTLYKNKLKTSQHIGNGNNFNIIRELETISNLFLKNCKKNPDIIAMDLHPSFNNKIIGKNISEKYNIKTINIQHHWAHASSLLVDNKLDECVALTLDGSGYGVDGNIWGGEVIYSSFSEFKRISHLENIPLIGSEKAVSDLKRLMFAINEKNGVYSDFLDEQTYEIFKKLSTNSIKTSSFGRILDALSFLFNICTTRTYEGEPAMKLEKLLLNGKFIPNYFETTVINNEIKTSHLFQQINYKLNKNDTIFSLVKTIINKMVTEASHFAHENNIKYIGLTGGVSYNQPISKIFKEEVKKLNLIPIFHSKIPNGDGGISIGQAAIANEF